MHLILVGGPDTVRLVRAVVVVVPSPLASPSAAADARLRSSSASFRAASKISRSRIAGRERLVSASLSDSAIQGVVSSAITSGRLPADTNGVYFVLTSADVNESSGFCTQYCGHLESVRKQRREEKKQMRLNGGQ